MPTRKREPVNTRRRPIDRRWKPGPGTISPNCFERAAMYLALADIDEDDTGSQSTNPQTEEPTR